MADIEERLSTALRAAADRVGVRTTAPPGVVLRVRRSRRRRVAGAAVAGAFAAALGMATLTMTTDLGRSVTTDPVAGDAGSTFPSPPNVSVDVGVVPESPLGSRVGASGVWTGSEFVVWGGEAGIKSASSAFSDGAAYDPVNQRWRLLPVGPLSARVGHTAVWTGDEMIVWGGKASPAGLGGGRELRDGAAYDPSTNVWRRIADARVHRSRGKGVLVGNHLVVGGGETSQGAYAKELLVYDIATDAWSEIPLEVGQHGGVYDIASAGSGVAVAVLDPGNDGPVPRFLHVEIPSARVQVSPALIANGSAHWLGVAWTGEQVVALALGEGATEVGLWRPGASQWSDTSNVPEERLRPRAGTHWHEAGAIQWFDGWLVSVGSTGVYVAAPQSAETAIPERLRTGLRRLCGGEAAIAFSEDSVFVWGAQDCAGQPAHPGGRLSTGTRVTLQRTPGR